MGEEGEVEMLKAKEGIPTRGGRETLTKP